MANQLYGYGAAGNLRSANEGYVPESSLLASSRYLSASDLSNSGADHAHSVFLSQNDALRLSSAEIGAAAAAAAAPATTHLLSHSSWPASDTIVAALKRPSEALYHQTVLAVHNTIGQSEAWFSTNSLAKRSRSESTNNLPIYPQRPGEKDCAHYMQTRTCKFGDSCKFDHPIWVPEGGIPDWKEVPLIVTNESLPERFGVPDCPYFLKTQRCKFGLRCKFNHPKDKMVSLDAVDNFDASALPERPSEPQCSFYMKTGQCKFGVTCKFHHPKDIQILLNGQEDFSGDQSDGTTDDAKPMKLPVSITPALMHNSKGLPVRPGDVDCPFYLKTGSCKYGSTCRYNHPDRNAINPLAAAMGHGFVASPTNLNIGVVNPVSSIFQTIDPRFAQLGLGSTIYPQRPGQIECDYYMKTGECKFGERCKFHHPIDRSAPTASMMKETLEQNVTLTLAGLPRREGAIVCPYYLKTGTCKFGATCKFDHPPPGEVMAMATSQGTSSVGEGRGGK